MKIQKQREQGYFHRLLWKLSDLNFCRFITLHYLGRIYYVQKIRWRRSQWKKAQINNRHLWIEKIIILGASLELPPKQHCQFSPFGPFSRWIGWIGRNWQCYLAGSSKTADYSFVLISIETYKPQFNGHNELFLDSVGKPCSNPIN